MSKLPRDLKPQKALRAFQRAGFEIDHVTGSHYILKKDRLRTAIPYHRSIKTGTLRAILSQCGMTIEEFIELL
jgi:predicted RNA binding protein YcfA (HicA-like mRNA interferase family)